VGGGGTDGREKPGRENGRADKRFYLTKTTKRGGGERKLGSNRGGRGGGREVVNGEKKEKGLPKGRTSLASDILTPEDSGGRSEKGKKKNLGGEPKD